MKNIALVVLLGLFATTANAGFLDSDPSQFPVDNKEAEIYARCYSGGTVVFEGKVLKATTLNNYSSQSPSTAYLTTDNKWEVFNSFSCRTTIKFR